MSKVSMSQIVADYCGIQSLESEATRRRANVVSAVINGRISSSDMADLLGITPSAVDQMVYRYKANHPSMLARG